MTAILSQKAISGAQLALFFASKARVVVLRVFLADPRRSYYQRQLSASTGLPIRAIQRELDRLTGAGLLYRRMEGNRAYFHVDTQYPLYPELRGMIVKSLEGLDRFRAQLAVDDLVRLVIVQESRHSILVVRDKRKGPPIEVPDGYHLELMKTEDFEQDLDSRPDSLSPHLEQGVDLLGRRDDLIWQRIEAAGFHIAKGKGVP